MTPIGHYNESYAARYINNTLTAPYTCYKNHTLAQVAETLGARRVLDIGCNVNPIMQVDGSLRYQMEQKEITYIGMDLSPEYFNKQLASNLGVPRSDIYKQVNGVVGDALHIPMESSSFDLIVCADVLEHVSDPDQAFKEIARVLSENGRALIVLPSMYKLDIANYQHIADRRPSSHESKLPFSEWAKKWQQAGFEIDHEISRPLGIASGLSYLCWLSDDFVPQREQLDGEEVYSENANLHREAKQILSKYDEIIDKIILSNPETASNIVSQLKAGNITEVFEILKNIVNTVNIPEEELEVLNVFFDSVLNIEFDYERIEKLIRIFESQDNPLLLMGNSILIVLKKRKKN